MCSHMSEDVASHVASPSGEELVHTLGSDLNGSFVEESAHNRVYLPCFDSAVLPVENKMQELVSDGVSFGDVVVVGMCLKEVGTFISFLAGEIHH